MSLNFDEFIEAHRQWEEMDKRLNKLIGFNPATSNHYGTIQLYNNRINAKTTDKEILEIREKYVAWRKEILAFFRANNYDIIDDEFNKLFCYDPMFGTITFLDTKLDLSKEIEFYHIIIENYIKRRTYNV